MRSLPLLTLLFTTTTLTAQAASYSMSGTACSSGRLSPGLGPVPLSVVASPRLGTSLDVVTESSANYPWGNRRIVYLLTGWSNTALGGLVLPLDVATLGLGGPACGLLSTSADLVTRVPSQSSHLLPATVSIPIPNNPALAGLVFFQQVASTEYTTFGGSTFSLQLSASGRGVVGF